MSKRIVAVAWLLAAFLGCEEFEHQHQVGIVEEVGGTLHVGDVAPDFSYTDAAGQQHSFHEIRGDVTILALAGSPGPNTCGLAGSLLQLAEKYRGLETKVMFICVCVPSNNVCGLKENVIDGCGLKSPRLIGLCDAGGRIRKDYGAKKLGVYYLIDADGKIAAMGDANDQTDIDKSLRAIVSAAETKKRGKQIAPSARPEVPQ
ncbi:MAG: redoxin domain-containing protein [Planctomycetes bacterium]|nr:redoxin domain-containing protein [Planctomycetota bacterium]